MKSQTSNTRFRVFLLLLCAIALVAFSDVLLRHPSASALLATDASVATDKSDYHPGDTVSISGSGWQVGEVVTLTIFESDFDAPWQAAVVADESGNISNKQFVILDHDGGVSFTLTASGGSSGQGASASFTDSAPLGNGTGVVLLTANDGTCISFTAAEAGGPDNWEVAQGGSYNMKITGVTECFGDTIKAFIQNSGTANFCIILNKVSAGVYSADFTMPNPACNTSPISYKCDASADCSNGNTYNAAGPSGASSVHFRANTFSEDCSSHVLDTDCAASSPTPTPSPSPQGCTISCPPPATVECGKSTDPSATGVPTVTGTCTATYKDSFAPACGATGVITRTWSVTGADNVTASCDQLITIVDTTPPTIGNPGANATIYCPSTPVFTPPTAADGCSTPTIIQDSDVTTQDNCGTYSRTVTWHARDACGNVSPQRSQTIVVECNNCGGLTMGFWQNKNGQGIITASGPKTGTAPLTPWLRQFNPFQDLSSTATSALVATYVYNIIKAANASGSSMNAMLKAQMLATALDVYFSDPVLGGNKIGAPAPIGNDHIDLTHICKIVDSGGVGTCSGVFYDVSAAFTTVAPCPTVLAMLLYENTQSNAGGTTWYTQAKATQEMAKNAFDAINNNLAFACP